jgi:DNA-binding HxlR family transcriptional regulator
MPTLTASAKREQSKREYNANLRECPGHQLLATLTDKWVTLVLSALADGPQRYSELSRTIAGASQKMLTQTLRTLERDGLVSRTVTPAVPVRVDYALTDLGTSLLPICRGIKAWAESHIEEVDAARSAYDVLR